ncbi:hypothetical protein ACVGW0_07080 [Enterobacter intestinihominis]
MTRSATPPITASLNAERHTQWILRNKIIRSEWPVIAMNLGHNSGSVYVR